MNSEIIIETKAFSFALIKTYKGTFVAEAPTSFISKKSIKGELIDFILHKDYINTNDSIVEAIVDNQKMPLLTEIIEIQWPFSSPNTITLKEWDSYILNRPNHMIRDEERVIENVLSYLFDLKEKPSSIVEYGSSHGELLKSILNGSFNVKLLGVDPSEEMIKYSSKNVPSVKIIKGDLHTNLNTQFDILISRAIASSVVANEELPEIFDNLLKMVKTQGLLIFHSLNPSLLSKEFLKNYGTILKSINTSNNMISPFYVLQKN